ncbi:MAG: hypothetical protein GVY28_12500 [Alphaproteobacteria bacterium]|jgi:hypothetical protein|nr:hypothetical protein [Alphaproteobacteria bacterium]
MRIGFTIPRTGSQALFFDRPRVISATDRATRSVLSRFGAFVRRRAADSVKRRSRSARPGEAPTRWGSRGSGVANIRFAYEPTERGVVIGPVRLNATARPGGKTVPELLEFGGQVRRRGSRRRLDYEPRPYVNPAFETEMDQTMPDMWRNSIRR